MFSFAAALRVLAGLETATPYGLGSETRCWELLCVPI